MVGRYSSWWLAAVALLLVVGRAEAHYPRESYVYLDVLEDRMEGHFEITVEDLARVIDLDTDNDTKVSQAEATSGADAIYAYMQPRLTFFHQGQAHPVAITGHRFLTVGFGTFVLLDFRVPSLGVPPESLEVEFDVPLQAVDDGHRSRLLIENNVRAGIVDNESVHVLLFEQGDGRKRFSLEGEKWYTVLGRFVVEGALHIWIGLDHILFLVALLLVSVVVRDATNRHGWVAVGDFRGAFVYLIKVVTIFTIAHSITLCLAGLGIVQLPVTPVEVLIALSIAVAAFNNLRPFLGERLWIVVFAFGLIHGFGFANVLAPLGLSQQHTGIALAGFNVGVELGQLAIVVVLFPILFALRRWPGYTPVVVRGGSVALILIALFWAVERSVEWLMKQEFMAALAMAPGLVA